jgi:hypothetical protein
VQLEIERLFGAVARRGVQDLERLRRAPGDGGAGGRGVVTLAGGRTALITEVVVVQARLERLRAELRRLADEAEPP